MAGIFYFRAMRCKQKLTAFLLVLFLTVFSGTQAAELNGTIKLGNKWQPVLFLASISTPENLNVASPDFIIAKTFINPNGTFKFEDLNLPEETQFYRFYLVKNEGSLVEFNPFQERNYVHLLLSNSSVLSFNADANSNSLEIEAISGDKLNQQLLQFDQILFQKKKELNNDLSKAQKDFLTLDLERFIRDFVDTCTNSMLGLYAIYQLDEKETDFLRNNKFYLNFKKKINHQYPNTTYSEAYNNLLNDLVGFRDMVCEIPGVAPKWKDILIWIESFLLLILLGLVYFLWKKNSAKDKNVEVSKQKSVIENLTIKEREILELLSEGKSNKEIAAELFIELSTVKTHLSSIYKQLNVANRKEAANRYRFIMSGLS